MAAALRTVRVMLPRSLLSKLAVQAEAENRSLTYLILRAVKAELGAGKDNPAAPSSAAENKGSERPGAAMPSAGEQLLPPLCRALEPWSRFFNGLIERGGPIESEYLAFSGWLDTLADGLRTELISALDAQILLFQGGRATSSTLTLQGFARVKPHGYPGDYELIDRIYQAWNSPDPALRNWDRYFNAQGAARSLRGCKAYFIRWLGETEVRLSRKFPKLNLLHLGGGPGREILEYFDGATDSRVSCFYTDPDPHAVSYAARVCAPLFSRVTFRISNPLAFEPEFTPHLIWAAGLFDYLDDRNLVSTLRRLWRLLRRAVNWPRAISLPPIPRALTWNLTDGWSIIGMRLT